jgi:putative copper resistance protein D
MDSMIPSLALVCARIVHFASTLQLAGIFIFVLVVESPIRGTLRKHALPMVGGVRERLMWFAWWCLTVSLASGAAWLLLLAARISDSSVTMAIRNSTVETLLTSTQFGHAWRARVFLAIPLVALLAWLGLDMQWRSAVRWVAAILSMSFLGALAWAGHGGATPGLLGEFHVAADALHLIAAGAWIGGLLPLKLLLSTTAQAPGDARAGIAHDAILRFSTLGMVAVIALTSTGLFNAWILVGDVRGLASSPYGVLLLVKIAIFLTALTIAAFNRTRLTRFLANETGTCTSSDALRRLKRNCLIEAALGLAIIVDVGLLGTISHAIHG